MGSGIFITGTDTGVGKTFFACGLAHLLRESGYRVGVMKPAETGCSTINGELFPDDAARLKEASGCELPLERICPYRLPDPVAPSVAAERQGIRIDIDSLVDQYAEISSSNDITLVEGAGGLMVPLLPSYTYADFAALLKLPVIVVAANRLGVINHLLLTLEHASCKGLRPLGYVLNHTISEASLAASTNRETLSTLTAVPCIGELPFCNGATQETPLSSGFADELDLSILNLVLA
ncbi:MAG TPA: dethiobiotin synthase [Candidatus Binatia bacterium]